MELFFLAVLVIVMALALGYGYPVAFALPGAAILSISLAAITGYVFAGETDAYFSHGGPGQWLSAGVTNLRGVYWEVERDTLIAIPLFIFMGIMLQRSRIAEDLLVTMAQLFGPVPGGLGISVVFVGALLAATTGIVGATVVAMGLISLPAMLRNNYSQSLATGTIAASGTLGQIIPPSIVLIILADQLASAVDQASTARKALHKASTGELSMPSSFDVASTSAGEMFLGAFVPGLVLVGLYMAFILGFAILRPKSAPAIPYEGKYDLQFAGQIALTLIPPLTLIFLVLGSIISGIATVNQAGAIGAAGALIMSGYRLMEGKRGAYWPALLAIFSLVVIGILLSNYSINIRKINTSDDAFAVTLAAIAVFGLIVSLVWSGWRALKVDQTLHGVMIETAKTTSLVFIILLGAAMLTAAFRAFGGEDLVKEFLNGLPGGFWTKFVIVMMVIFVLGFFLDFIEIAVVVVPIIAPILLADPSANVTAVWLGVMIGLNIQTSFLTPPFGFALFYLRGVAPALVKTVQMYKGVIAFIALQILALVIVGLYPQLVNYLPNRVSFTSETAPPPRNPRLQLCLEDYVYEQLQRNGATLRTAISGAKGLELSFVEKGVAKNLSSSFEKADEAFAKMDAVQVAAQAVVDATPDYRPLHREVRSLEAGIRKLESAKKGLKSRIDRYKRTGGISEPALKALEDDLGDYDNEIAELTAAIPAGWDEAHETFVDLMKAEAKARLQYRRTVDDAYGAVTETLVLLETTNQLPNVRSQLDDLIERTEDGDADGLIDAIKDFTKDVRSANAAADVAKQLSKARRALKKKPDERAKVFEHLDLAREALMSDIAWRERAVSELLPALKDYEQSIRTTIGARQQERMPQDQALFVAACNSGHRDVSLNF